MSDRYAPSSSSAQIPEIIEIGDDDVNYSVPPPAPKVRKMRMAGAPKLERLANRLGDILCCIVCLDLPKYTIYQCINGHLMCAGCFAHVLADARLRDETATCPNCRVEISKNTASRNLAVEKAVSELPSECKHCRVEFPRNTLSYHEEFTCLNRSISCRFYRIGCPWRGPYKEREQHEAVCTHPHKSREEIIETLERLDERCYAERNLYGSIFDLLSHEKVAFIDLQMKPFRTDEFIQKLVYETSRFSAFNNQWVLKACMNTSQRDPTMSCERTLTYQLSLKTKTSLPLSISYLILRGPFGDMKVLPKIYRNEYSEQDNEGPFVLLPLIDTTECNRVLAGKAINFRLILVWHLK